MTVPYDPVRGSSEPNRCWTFTNISEATPDILSPLCWSVWGHVAQETLLASLAALGVLGSRDVQVWEDQNRNGTGVIYGRQAFNVDVMRELMSRIPGMDPDDFERDLLGTVRASAPTYPGASPLRIPIVAAKAPYTLFRSPGQIAANYAETTAWWRAEVLEVFRGAAAPKRSPIDDLMHARDRFARSFYLHSFTRFVLTAIQGAVTKAAEKAGEPMLGTAALSGQGGVTETELADDTWRLAHEQFDVDAFVARYGYRGPNEGNVYTRSWREQPDRVRAMAKAQAGRPDLMRPIIRSQRTMAESQEAATRLLRLTRPKDRAALKFVLARARNVIPRLEIGKAAYVMPLDGARAAARRLGIELVAAGRIDDIDDTFFMTIPELQQAVSGTLPQARELVEFRRNARAEYREMRLPVHFTGMPAPAAADDTVRPIGGQVELSGVASGGGSIEGRARVVLDPNDDVELEEGDILVCKFTDPSWAPLFTLAEALVIDLGGAASHGAVVAREMGIPYVIGTQVGTATIRDGDRLQVDGATNTVRILQ